nr:MTH1187 family thiamine-binding protein [Crateriforma conspicua]
MKDRSNAYESLQRLADSITRVQNQGLTTYSTCTETIQMKVIVDLCVVPIGVGVSVSKYVAECQKVLQEAGLEHQLHAYGTNIEGDWDDVFAAIKQCHERVHAMGAPRITTSIKVGTRTDREQTMQEKIDSVRFE